MFKKIRISGSSWVASILIHAGGAALCFSLVVNGFHSVIPIEVAKAETVESAKPSTRPSATVDGKRIAQLMAELQAKAEAKRKTAADLLRASENKFAAADKDAPRPDNVSKASQTVQDSAPSVPQIADSAGKNPDSPAASPAQPGYDAHSASFPANASASSGADGITAVKAVDYALHKTGIPAAAPAAPLAGVPVIVSGAATNSTDRSGVETPAFELAVTSDQMNNLLMGKRPIAVVFLYGNRGTIYRYLPSEGLVIEVDSTDDFYPLDYSDRAYATPPSLLPAVQSAIERSGLVGKIARNLFAVRNDLDHAILDQQSSAAKQGNVRLEDLRSGPVRLVRSSDGNISVDVQRSSPASAARNK